MKANAKSEKLRQNYCGNEDLGEISISYTFVFAMRVKKPKKVDDESVSVQRISLAEDTLGVNDPNLEIPLEAWMLFQQLWKNGFYTEHHVSNDVTKLFLCVGLPFKLLCNSAQRMGLNMRLQETKGTVPFHRQFMPMYVQYPNGSCFNSGHRQQITLYRLERKVNFNPEFRPYIVAKKELKKIVKMVSYGRSVRSHEIHVLFTALGVYRPNLARTMTATCTVKQLRALTKIAEKATRSRWFVVEPPAFVRPPAPRTLIRINS